MHRTPRTNPQDGFSLIELLIVVLIIGIIAAIAVPNYMNSQQAANSASAVASLRLINSSEANYRITMGVYGDLPTLVSSGYINDPALQSGRKSNYVFSVSPNSDPTSGYSATGTPLVTPSGSYYYFTDGSGVIRYNVGSAAGASSSPIPYY